MDAATIYLATMSGNKEAIQVQGGITSLLIITAIITVIVILILIAEIKKRVEVK